MNVPKCNKGPKCIKAWLLLVRLGCENTLQMEICTLVLLFGSLFKTLWFSASAFAL